MKNHQDIAKRLNDYVDGTLSEIERDDISIEQALVASPDPQDLVTTRPGHLDHRPHRCVHPWRIAPRCQDCERAHGGTVAQRRAGRLQLGFRGDS